MKYNNLISHFNETVFKNLDSDQAKGVPEPAAEKSIPENAELISLDNPESFNIYDIKLVDAIRNRKSYRKFIDKPLTKKEISFLLWATQGLRKRSHEEQKPSIKLRNVPSGGAKHPFETYVIINNVQGLKRGLYRYVASTHQLLWLKEIKDLSEKLFKAVAGQKFVSDAPVTFIWTAIPYRTEWRYGDKTEKLVAQDSGHLCQNLYLAVEAINCGTCGIGAYLQNEMDTLVDVDGQNEFVVYAAPVGKLNY